MFSSAALEDRGPQVADVEVATLKLLGAPTSSGLVAVREVRGGFAELELTPASCLLPLDFLPPCRSGDVLRFARRGSTVRMWVDEKATQRAEKKLLRLWSMLSA